jgi:hypothetical protein
MVRDKLTGKNHACPCGRCPDCLRRRAAGWSFRLLQQEKVSHTSLFVTLTYNTTTVPFTGSGNMSLNKRDCQLFMKRLRKQYPSGYVSYYLCGEYGSNTNRPHYHALIFNADEVQIQKAWQSGDCHFGRVTGASVGYCLKYMMKPGRIPLFEGDDRVPEFQLCSKGLGKSYLTDQMKYWHKASVVDRMYLQLEGGARCSMPRYYKDRIYDEKDKLKASTYYEKVGDRLDDEDDLLLMKTVAKGQDLEKFKAERFKADIARVARQSVKNDKF